ncbi:hypothetical protein KR059_006408 [Drosophila kikkawai]|nr:hypothetical protein KR059_006408 [Drosophila kikkawai]
MANKGLYIERNGNQRAAGLPSLPGEPNFRELLFTADPLDIIRNHMQEQCWRKKPEPIGKRTPCFTDTTIQDILTTETHFTTKSAEIGEIMATHSKPSHVTNWSQTFGRVLPPSESLYSTIMPRKTDEQVHREYAEYHRGRIVSHNHYFPAEKINRGYTKPFNPNETFGKLQGGEPSGSVMKKCLEPSDEHLTVVNKPWMEFVQRTRAPLGRKYEKYLDQVPDLNFGTCKHDKCTTKMLLENINPCELDDTLDKALSYLNELRDSLHKRNDFDMTDLLARLERIDKENTGYMPLPLILQTMYKLNIRVHEAKIRTTLAHFRMIIDEGCATERVNYDQFCRLLSIQIKLPDVEQTRIVPDNMYHMETTYRLFTSDRLKKPVQDRPYRRNAIFKLSDIITPNCVIEMGLTPSDFNYRRDKAEMERIFEIIMSKEDFEAIWERLMVEQKESPKQDGRVSVNQFRKEMEKETTSDT